MIQMKEKYKNPLYLLICTTLYLFVAEACVMILLALFPNLPEPVHVLVDSLLLVLLALPILYFFLFKPLLHHITTREKAERELKHSHDFLESIIEERTQELRKSNEELKELINDYKESEHERRLLESQLQQAQKMEAIGTLAGGIAHDFNNILTAVMGYAELAKYGALKGKNISGDIGEIIIAGNRAKELVDQILTFSRQSKHELKPIQIQKVIREGLKLVRASIPTTIEIKQQINQTCDAVLSDITQVNQILMNLCTNAYHAMRNSGGVITVNLNQVELDGNGINNSKLNLSEGKYVELAVNDTGHGMGPEVIKRIFEPYFSTKELGQGTGLGLALVHGIIKSHNGDIVVTSEVGKGTTVKVYWPCMESNITDISIHRDETIIGGNERILLVDDDESIVRMEKRMLEEIGYKVTDTSNCEEALRIFNAAPDDFDLIITDMTMPFMTGAELAKNILALRPHIPIILCTGFSETIDEDKAKALGISAFVMKPVVMSKIAQIIRKVLK